MTTSLTLEQIQAIRDRAFGLSAPDRRHYLAGVRDGLDMATEGERGGTLAGGKETQEFFDYLDSDSAPVLPDEGAAG